MRKTIKLKWNKHPYGGEYAAYKMGNIQRIRINKKMKYSIVYGYRQNSKNATCLADAKKKLDKISK